MLTRTQSLAKKNALPFPRPPFLQKNKQLNLRKSKYPLEESTQPLEEVAGNDDQFGSKTRSGTVAERHNPQRGECVLLSAYSPVLHYHCFSQFDRSY